jgi:hypothetical protein
LAPNSEKWLGPASQTSSSINEKLGPRIAAPIWANLWAGKICTLELDRMTVRGYRSNKMARPSAPPNPSHFTLHQHTERQVISLSNSEKSKAAAAPPGGPLTGVRAHPRSSAPPSSQSVAVLLNKVRGGQAKIDERK